MQLGLIGLGKMGAGMARRLRREGDIDVVAYDRDPAATQALASDGVGAAASLTELVAGLKSPRHVWVMVPAGEATTQTIHELAELLDAGDVVIDGGNSRWTDDAPRADYLATKGIGYIDAGTSGGVWGLENGYCLMVGGSEHDVAGLAPVLDALAPAVVSEVDRAVIGDAARSRRRDRR